MDTSGGGANSKPDVPDKAATPRPSYTYPPVRGYLVSAGRVLLLAASVAFLLVCALLSVAITVPRLSRPVGAPAFPTLAATRALPSAVPSTATPAIAGTGTPTPPPTSTRHAGGPPPPAPTATPTDSPFVTPTAFPTVTPLPMPTDTLLPPTATPVPTFGGGG